MTIIQVELSVLIARLVISGTCLMTMTLIMLWGYMTSIHKGPTFVKILVILISLGNIGGMLFSYSMYDNNIYDNWRTFGWQFTVMSMYWGCSVLSYWVFSF